MSSQTRDVLQESKFLLLGFSTQYTERKVDWGLLRSHVTGQSCSCLDTKSIPITELGTNQCFQFESLIYSFKFKDILKWTWNQLILLTQFSLCAIPSQDKSLFCDSISYWTWEGMRKENSLMPVPRRHFKMWDLCVLRRAHKTWCLHVK